MKKLVLAVALAVGTFGIGSVHATGIPVVDVALLAENQINQTANLAKYVEMITQYKTQIDQMKQQYDSLTGSRGLGMIANSAGLQDYLPADWQDVYRSVQNGGYDGLTGAGKAIVDANRLFNRCASMTGRSKSVCDREGAKAAQDKAFAMAAFDKSKQRWDQIETLMGEINSTTDAKAIAELQARINAEQAAVANEQTKLQMFAMIAEAEDRLIQQQKRELRSEVHGREAGYVFEVTEE